MKSFIKFISLVFITLLFVTHITPIHADDSYQMLAPLPVVSNATGSAGLGTYIPNVVKLAIGIAGALAVIRIIMGGIKYMSTDAFDGKSDAKETINNAIIGLLLAMSAYIILYTVNPKLVTFDFSVAGLRVGAPIDTTVVTSTTVVTGPSAGVAWPSDSTDRTNLTNLHITINNFNCAKVGDVGCTSVESMGQSVINGLEKLKKGCGCVVEITGGTEYWLHGNRSTEIDLNKTQHKPGGTVVDLSLSNEPMNIFIRTHGTPAKGTDCTTGTERYNFQGGLYVNEQIDNNSPHWHVCF